jgi:hypothetical protein|tara:strand:+ start:5684 stop:6259 length:576 start_codon:yes stop_codon:yes gene_type:complete
MSVAGQFAALPMESLIGGPLNAAATAQGQLASITSEFIQNIGLEKDKDGKLSARTVDFHYEKPVKVTDDKGAETWTKVPMDLTVPLLTIVKAPNLQVKEVNVQFDMEVKTSSSSSNETKKDASVEASWSGWGAKVKFNASVSNTQKSQRSSDTSAKYHIDVKALDEGAPEGLMKVLDILQEAIQPSEGASK